jgi:myosin-9
MLFQDVLIESDSPSEKYEFERLKNSMVSVGFGPLTQQKMFGIISAVLLLGNITYLKRQGYHSDESAYIENEELVAIIANLLEIKAQQLNQALTMRRTVLKHDTVITRHHMNEATLLIFAFNRGV